jgi:hypothetical protein
MPGQAVNPSLPPTSTSLARPTAWTVMPNGCLGSPVLVLPSLDKGFLMDVGPTRARQDYRDAEVSTRLPAAILLLQATIEGSPTPFCARLGCLS